MMNILFSLNLAKENNNIANALTSMKKEKINSALVSSYLNHAIDSFLVDMARRYDVKGKTYFNYPNKY